jgi:hypothetical protein
MNESVEGMATQATVGRQCWTLLDPTPDSVKPAPLICSQLAVPVSVSRLVEPGRHSKSPQPVS